MTPESVFTIAHRAMYVTLLLAARAVVARGLSDAMSSQNCSSETPPNASTGHSSSSTSDPFRQPTRRRDLAVSSASSGSAARERRPAARGSAMGGSESSRTCCGPVKSMTVLEPVRSAVRPFPDLAPPEDRPDLADCQAAGGRRTLNNHASGVIAR